MLPPKCATHEDSLDDFPVRIIRNDLTDGGHTFDLMIEDNTTGDEVKIPCITHHAATKTADAIAAALKLSQQL